MRMCMVCKVRIRRARIIKALCVCVIVQIASLILTARIFAFLTACMSYQLLFFSQRPISLASVVLVVLCGCALASFALQTHEILDQEEKCNVEADAWFTAAKAQGRAAFAWVENFIAIQNFI